AVHAARHRQARAPPAGGGGRSRRRHGIDRRPGEGGHRRAAAADPAARELHSQLRTARPARAALSTKEFMPMNTRTGCAWLAGVGLAGAAVAIDRVSPVAPGGAPQGLAAQPVEENYFGTKVTDRFRFIEAK